jgi:hypothetical protein
MGRVYSIRGRNVKDVGQKVSRILLHQRIGANLH